MLKKTIKYTDYNDVEREEDFYFNYSDAEIVELETSVNGGLSALFEKITKQQDQKNITEHFKELILKAYGEKSLDGKRFIKNKELRDEFEQTEAFSILFMELLTSAEAASAFFNGLVSKKARERLAEEMAKPDAPPELKRIHEQYKPEKQHTSNPYKQNIR